MKTLLFSLCLLCGCSIPPPVQPTQNFQSQMQEEIKREEEARRAYFKSPAGQRMMQESSNTAKRAAEAEAARRP